MFKANVLSFLKNIVLNINLLLIHVVKNKKPVQYDAPQPAVNMLL